MKKGIGHNELYKMGFDGAAIETLRKLTFEQRRKLFQILEILEEREGER